MTLQPMYPGFANSPKTTITAALSASDATISVADANCLPDGPNYATIGTGDNAEVVKYTGKSGSNLTGVVRGISGVARVWQTGAQIYRAYTDPDHEAFIENINALNDGKLDKTGDAKDATVTASAASSRVNLASGDTLAVIVGKLMKWYADFKALAWKATVGTADIDDNAATNAKLAQMGAGTIKGNAGSATANASDLTAAQARGVIIESTSAVDAIADDDKIILQDVSASAGSRTKHVLWSAIKTALNSVYAPLSHASRHASGGADPVTPAAIGASASTHTHGSISNDGKLGSTADLPVFTLSAGAIGTKNKADAKIALDIEARGFEYGGRAIPLTWAQIRAKVAAGDFTGLRVGDYKDITLNGSFTDAVKGTAVTLTNHVFRMEIAGIDSYYQYGDTPVPHHVDFISRDCLANVLQYNATDTNSGAFIGSALFTTLNGANGIQKLLPSDVAAVIKVKRGLTEVKTAANASSWAWNDMGKLWLPTEQEVWGHTAWAELKYGCGLSVQYPIFRDGLRHIIKGAGNGGGRCDWWCASSAAASAAYFCAVGGRGYPAMVVASTATMRVPLCFRVA